MTSLLRTGSLGEPSSLAQTVSVGSAARRFGAFDARLVRIIGVELAAFEVFPPSGSDGSLPSGGFSEGGRKEVNGGQSGGVREVRVVCEVWNWYAKTCACSRQQSSDRSKQQLLQAGPCLAVTKNGWTSTLAHTCKMQTQTLHGTRIFNYIGRGGFRDLNGNMDNV